MQRHTLLLAIASFALANPLHAATYLWDASSGLFPNQVSPPMTLNDMSEPENPQLAAGVLTIANDFFSETMAYYMGGIDIQMPSHLTIATQMRFVSGSASDGTRSAAEIRFQTAPGVGNSLFIEADSIFLLSGINTRGPSVGMGIDTNESFHTYRIEVSGTGSGSSIQVFQDGILRLTGNTFSSANYGNPLVLFGDATGIASGISEWTSFSHNAAAPKPVLVSFSLAEGNARVTIQSSVIGHTYQLQYRDELMMGAWQSYGAAQSGTGADLMLTMPVDTAATLKRFYRVFIQQ